MTWWKKEEPITPKPEFLKPGECECGHSRCLHTEGRYKCQVAIYTDDYGRPLLKEQWGMCACQIYIPDDDDDGDSGPPDPVDPEVAELQRMIKL